MLSIAGTEMTNGKRIDIRSMRSANYDANYYGSRGPKGNAPCLLCGRGVNHEKAYWVNVDCTTGEIVEGNPTDHFEYGYEPIGRDCWKSHKSILQGLNIERKGEQI